MNYLICKILLLLLLLGTSFGHDLISIWDIDSILDYSTMDVETLWTADTTVVDILGLEMISLKVGEIRYVSFGGDSGDISIQAFFAYPSDGSNLAAFVVNHGIIMNAELEMAMTFASGINAFVLAIGAPGHGASEGGSAYHLPNLVRAYPDPRNNHFYQFAYATMRGINYLERLSIVDDDWLGVLGFSGGADAAFLANAIDERVSICVPIIPQTDFACCGEEGGWMINVMEISEYTEEDSNVINLQEWIAPINYASMQNGFVMMMVASQDEFEPLRCAKSTYEELDPDNSRWEIIGNFDHHCYFTPYGLLHDYDSFDNTGDFYLKILGNVNTLVGLLRLGTLIPAIPTITTVDIGDSTEFRVYTDAVFWTSNDAKLWFSTDSAYTFSNIPMSQHYVFPISYFKVRLPNTGAFSLENLIFYGETRSLPFFYLSTLPQIPPDITFKIRLFPYDFFAMSISESYSKPNKSFLKAYPNPFNSAITIETDSEEIQIYDVLGRQKEQIKVSNGFYNWQPRSDLPSGIYFIRSSESSVSNSVLYIR